MLFVSISFAIFLSVHTGADRVLEKPQDEILERPHDQCTKLRTAYSESLKDFDHCVLENAVPVSVCRSCVESYVNIVQAFQKLTSTYDPKFPRERCSDHFMNQDTLNIVWRQYQNSRNLWNNAACTSCFVNECDPDKIANAKICQPNAQIIVFHNSTVELQACFNVSDRNRGDVCKDCLTAFNTLEENYKKLPNSPNGVCFEAVDEFNRTSCKWYGDKKCPRRPEVHISTAWEAMIIIIGLLILSGMSYGGFYAFTIYRQRGSYVEQINTEDGNVTPPIYS